MRSWHLDMDFFYWSTPKWFSHEHMAVHLRSKTITNCFTFQVESFTEYVFRLFLTVLIFSNWQIVFEKLLNKWGVQHLYHLLVKPRQGTMFSTSFHVSSLLRNFIADGSRNSSIYLKYNSSLSCIAVWVCRYFFLFYSGFYLKNVQHKLLKCCWSW